MEKYDEHETKSTPPAALVIFANGLAAAPTVVPNGGSEELDNEILAWFQSNLRQSRQGRKAA